MQRLSTVKHAHLVKLRLAGKSIPEISKETQVAKTTVLRHIQQVKVPDSLQIRLREKQGGSKARAIALRANIKNDAAEKIGELSNRDWFMLLLGLYWGEGTKRDFSLMNSDPLLIKVFILGIKKLGIRQDRISIMLRLHKGLAVPSAKKYWAEVTGYSSDKITQIEIIDAGNKKGKLPYGMCRVRVSKGIRERLLIQSAIALVGSKSIKR